MIEDAGHEKHLDLFAECPECKRRVFKFASGQLIEHKREDTIDSSLCPRIRLPAWTLGSALDYVKQREAGANQHLYTLSLRCGPLLFDGFTDDTLEIIATPSVGLTATMDNFLDFILWLDTVNTLKLDEMGWTQVMRKRRYADAHARKIEFFVVYNPTP